MTRVVVVVDVAVARSTMPAALDTSAWRFNDVGDAPSIMRVTQMMAMPPNAIAGRT
jgi:hypothetical protein